MVEVGLSFLRQIPNMHDVFTPRMRLGGVPWLGLRQTGLVFDRVDQGHAQ